MSLHRPFRSSGESFTLVAANAVAGHAARVRVTGVRARDLLAPLFADWSDARALRLIAAELGTVVVPRDNEEVLARLVAAIDVGRLVVVRVDPSPGWGLTRSPRPERPTKAEEGPLQPRQVGTHWLEIRLTDEEEVGVAGQRYLVVDPDGRQHRGYTDALGSARITRLSPGICKVCFPDLDGGVCERVTAPG